MKLDFMKIYERAVRMIWQRKILWLFGFLSLFGGCGSNNIGTNFNSNFSSTSDGGGGLGGLRADQFVRDYLVLLIVIALFLILLGIVLMVLGYIARAGLIHLASEYGEGAAPTAGEGFSAGSHYWLKLLAIDLVLYAPIVLAIVLFVLVIALIVWMAVPGASAGIASGETGAVFGALGGAVCLVLAVFGVMILVLIPVMILLGVLQILAHRACVLGGEGIFDSIRWGYRTIRTRFGDVALMWLIRVAIGIAISIVMMLVGLLVVGIPIAIMFLNVIVGAIFLLPGVLVLLFLSGIVEAFTSAAWTLAYKDMTRAPVAAEPAPAT